MTTLRILTLLIVTLGSQPLWAAKENLVLLPIQGPELSETDAESYRVALAEALQGRYRVYSGSSVEEKLEAEYEALHCDTTKCLQNVAVAFNGELVARAMISKIPSGYLITFEIKNIIDDEIVDSATRPCQECDQVGVIERLQEIGRGGEAVISFPTSTPKEVIEADNQEVGESRSSGISWYWWAIGAAVIGGAAAAAAGGDSGGGGEEQTTTTQDEGEFTVRW
ncbi:MAG: hypothetical protein HQL48_08025 [Gammaproteobacteria bacterium]|nr:hypothetical protein [Gammaproteobacteria bacterium]